MSPVSLLCVFLAIFLIAAILLKVPVAYAIGAGTLGTLVAAKLPLMGIAQAAFSSLDSFPLLAVPFFIFAGALMQYSGISKSLLDFVDSFVGRLRGNLGAVTILGSAAFGVLTGSCMATISSIGNIMVPEMVKRGYRKSYAAAIIAASSFLGILIPPSVPGIIYGLSAGVSISQVWLCTIGPAFIFIIAFMIVNYFKHGRHEAKTTEPLRLGPYTANIGKSFLHAVPSLLMPLIIFGGIYGGIFTATEAGAAATLYGLLFFLIKLVIKREKMEMGLLQITVASAVSTATISMLIVFSSAAGRAISLIGIADAIAQVVQTHFQSPILFLLIVNVIFLVLGMLIDINAAIMIMVPLLMPSVNALGIDPVHFGAILLVNLSVGYITPPFACSIFVAQKIAGAKFGEVVKDCMPFVVLGLVVIVITTYFPAIATFIPSLLG